MTTRRRGKVLVVDDDRIVARSLARMLASEHDVTVVHWASEAVERLRAGARYDMIVSDMMMPEMTGAQFHAAVARLAREQAEAMVFVTGGAFTAETRAFLESVPNPRFEKPFDMLRLKRLIAERLR